MTDYVEVQHGKFTVTQTCGRSELSRPECRCDCRLWPPQSQFEACPRSRRAEAQLETAIENWRTWTGPIGSFRRCWRPGPTGPSHEKTGRKQKRELERVRFAGVGVPGPSRPSLDPFNLLIFQPVSPVSHLLWNKLNSRTNCKLNSIFESVTFNTSGPFWASRAYWSESRAELLNFGFKVRNSERRWSEHDYHDTIFPEAPDN